MNSFTTVIDLQFQIHDVTHDKTHHSKMDLKTMLFGNGWKRGQRNQTQDIAATSEVDTKKRTYGLFMPRESETSSWCADS